jgi:peptide/nickel transport system permease protein
MNGDRILNFAVTVVLAASLLGLVYTPYDPSAQSFRETAFAGSSMRHWVGVDGLGRDYASRLWRGAGNTVSMAGSALGISFLTAVALLAAAERLGRGVNRLIEGAIGVWVAVPVLFIGLVLLVFMQPSAVTLVLAAALGTVPLAYRQLRILWLEQRHAQYVQASEALGARGRQLFIVTLWPNLRPDVVALGKLIFAICVLELSGLAFLGLIGDPDFPELGAILRQNQAYLFRNPLLVVWPGVILCGLLTLVHMSKGSEGNR